MNWSWAIRWTRPRNLAAVVRALIISGLAASFWAPAARSTNGHFPAPLDDVYIYFQIARSTSEGCVLCFGEEAGATTGATSPTYALLLSVLAFAARSPVAMGWAVAALTVLLLLDTSRSLARLMPDRPQDGGVFAGVLAALAPLLPFTLPILNWSLLSGMESAWVAALMARAVGAVDEVQRSTPDRRATLQWKAGVGLGFLAVSRPELAVMAFAFMVSVLHAAGRASGTLSLPRAVVRTVVPSSVLLLAHALFSTLAAGSSVPAGALRKVVIYDPTATGLQRGIVFLTNVLRLFVEGFEMAWGLPLLLILGIGTGPLMGTRSRRLGIPLLLGGLASFLLVSFNRTAPFQNLRYLAPTYLSILFVAVLGLARAADSKHRAWRVVAFGAAGVAALLMLRSHPKQATHYASAAKNIHEQQVAVGLQLKDDPLAETLFVGDAGAIPYFSEKPTLDGLGLGGWKKLPFARASVLGEAAVVELIERLPGLERPDTLAVYTSWWPQLTGGFGTPVRSVRIEGNVICADPVKTIYRADWSTLEAAESATDGHALDFADLVSEAEHALVFHGETEPRAGWFILADASGAKRFDGTRALAASDAFSFRVDPSGAPPADSMLAVDWTVAPSSNGTLRLTGAGFDEELAVVPEEGSRWKTVRLMLPAHTSELRVAVLRGRVDIARVSVESAP